MLGTSGRAGSLPAWERWQPAGILYSWDMTNHVYICYGIDMSNDIHTWHSRGYLPHFDNPGSLQIVTIRLQDSLPAELIRKIYASIPSSKYLLRKQHIEAYLDKCHGSCWLKQPALAAIVQESILHFDQERYRMLAWVIMPNHVHMMLEQFPEFPLAKLMFSLKSYTAKQINQKLNRSGTVWQREYFDRIVRDADHYRAAVEYIHLNPVKAGLVEQPELWKFSSASSAFHRERQLEPLAKAAE